MSLASRARSIAVRGNVRGQLFHPLDPRYVRVSTAEMAEVLRDLCRRADLRGIDCVLGFPEGGTPVAYAGADVLGVPLAMSSLKPHQLPNEISFDEPHLTLTEGRTHFIYALNPGDRVVIVEDEITTGTTILNAVRALRAAGVHVDDVLVLLIADDPRMLAAIEAEGVSVTAHERFPVAVSQAVLDNRGQ